MLVVLGVGSPFATAGAISKDGFFQDVKQITIDPKQGFAAVNFNFETSVALFVNTQTVDLD